MWRPRDRERFIGTYDPEHELPDPDRRPGDRWQSDAYRRGAHDSRYAYRMSPDRIESHAGQRTNVDREMEMRWRRDARDHGGYGGGYDRNVRNGGPEYGDRIRREYGSGYDRDRFDPFGRSFDDYGRDYGRESSRAYASEFEPDDDHEFDELRWREGESMSREPRRGPHWDQDRFYGSDRGWDRGWDNDRSFDRGRGRSSYEGDFAVWERDRDRWRR